jgi:tellurite resistance protein TerC
MIEWIVFGFLVFILLGIDLGLSQKSHTVAFKEAIVWSVIWVGTALLFNLYIYYAKGPEAGFSFLAAYLIEKSLSVDNIFVFLLVFKYFQVPSRYLHKILFWGIFGAIIMRAIFIIAGIAIVTRFHWVIYLFGAFLVFTGIKMMLQKDKELQPENNPVLKLFKRFVPVTDSYESGKFFEKQTGRLVATPLFIVLLFIETTDVIFAVDSIPAVFAITLDPFIAFTSNIFAILGLRALFFVLAGMMDKFHLLNYGLSAILIFVGIKMLIADIYHIPMPITLGGLAVILMMSIVGSILWPKDPEHA